MTSQPVCGILCSLKYCEVFWFFFFKQIKHVDHLHVSSELESHLIEDDHSFNVCVCVHVCARVFMVTRVWCV